MLVRCVNSTLSFFTYIPLRAGRPCTIILLWSSSVSSGLVQTNNTFVPSTHTDMTFAPVKFQQRPPATTYSKSHLQFIFSINVIAPVNTPTIFLPLLRVAARSIIPPTSLYNSGLGSSAGGGNGIPIPHSPHFARAVIPNVTSTIASLGSAARGEGAEHKVCGYRMSKAAVSSCTINLNNQKRAANSS
jgi:NAD(P)-dependent dehydrogenase (short-subunit alcohol dehydrogenase family)